MIENKRQLLITYLDSYLSRNASYHNHKETMVNAALLLQLGLLGVVLTKDWSLLNIPIWLAVLIYLFFWFLIHVYMKWQLSKKFIANVYHIGIDKSVRELISNQNQVINYSNISKNKTNKQKKILNSILYSLTFYFKLTFYPAYPIVKHDYTTLGFPIFVEENIIRSFKEGTTGDFHEKLMNRGSLIILLLALLKIIFIKHSIFLPDSD